MCGHTGLTSCQRADYQLRGNAVSRLGSLDSSQCPNKSTRASDSQLKCPCSLTLRVPLLAASSDPWSPKVSPPFNFPFCPSFCSPKWQWFGLVGCLICSFLGEILFWGKPDPVEWPEIVCTAQWDETRSRSPAISAIWYGAGPDVWDSNMVTLVLRRLLRAKTRVKVFLWLWLDTCTPNSFFFASGWNKCCKHFWVCSEHSAWSPLLNGC